MCVCVCALPVSLSVTPFCRCTMSCTTVHSLKASDDVSVLARVCVFVFCVLCRCFQSVAAPGTPVASRSGKPPVGVASGCDSVGNATPSLSPSPPSPPSPSLPAPPPPVGRRRPMRSAAKRAMPYVDSGGDDSGSSASGASSDGAKRGSRRRGRPKTNDTRKRKGATRPAQAAAVKLVAKQAQGKRVRVTTDDASDATSVCMLGSVSGATPGPVARKAAPPVASFFARVQDAARKAQAAKLVAQVAAAEAAEATKTAKAVAAQDRGKATRAAVAAVDLVSGGSPAPSQEPSQSVAEIAASLAINRRVVRAYPAGGLHADTVWRLPTFPSRGMNHVGFVPPGPPVDDTGLPPADVDNAAVLTALSVNAGAGATAAVGTHDIASRRRPWPPLPTLTTVHNGVVVRVGHAPPDMPQLERVLAAPDAVATMKAIWKRHTALAYGLEPSGPPPPADLLAFLQYASSFVAAVHKPSVAADPTAIDTSYQLSWSQAKVLLTAAVVRRFCGRVDGPVLAEGGVGVDNTGGGGASPAAVQDWPCKYQPTKAAHVCGNRNHVTWLSKWLADWKAAAANPLAANDPAAAVAVAHDDAIARQLAQDVAGSDSECVL